ncbi:hypothetical protein AIOL_003825 [Candidatus Rhodobacter oscarellae]|uniref:Uncharacterized protein n=2 Tax=Candidatus Rhodobacter oscarellae TaxID=1675527 RepID=A0A0J9EAZ0_9RHOB|nr:hypothetical protein AIOL_003825 [Candidatus Rhodobacter lobularis]
MTLPSAKAQYLADALGQVRAEMKALKAREEALREALLEARANAPIQGERFVATIRRGTRRSFDAKSLPAAIRDDPRYWKETASCTVLIRERAGKAEREDDIVLVEPF